MVRVDRRDDGSSVTSRVHAQIAVGVAAISLGGLSVAATLEHSGLHHRGWLALVSALALGVPVAVGLFAWVRESDSRFGPLLALTGLLWGMTTLSAAGNDTIYSIGRVSLWAAELSTIYLVLSFPSSTLDSRIARRVFYAACALVVCLYLPTALLVAQYDQPFPWTTCVHGCQSNAFMVVNSEPGVIHSLVSPIRDALAAAVFASVIAVLAVRIRNASHLLRVTLVPVLAAAIVGFSTGSVVFGRHFIPESTALALEFASLLSIPLISVGFLVGLLRRRLLEGRMLTDLTVSLADEPDPVQLQASLSRILEDPTLEIRLANAADPDTWRGIDGEWAPPPIPSEGRDVIEIPSPHPNAAIIYDAALTTPPGLIEAVGALVAAELDRGKLENALGESVREVSESRSRIAAAGDKERQRLERDLHDSAQQQLIVLRIQLELESERLGQDPRASAHLSELGKRIDTILEEIRSVSRGIYPALLADAGLEGALRAAAMHSQVPAAVDADGVGRLPEEIEGAVYFCCLEAIQNVAKHASGAHSIRITLVREGNLKFKVRDDGPGFSLNGNAPANEDGGGSGLTNMRDRVEAAGGRLRIESAPGKGTQISGELPVT